MVELIFIEERPVSGRKHAIQPGTTIGRADCDILLADPDVSRRHAVIRQVDTGLAIEDLGSTNGTYVNEQQIAGITELQAGATIRFGNTVWHLEAPADATRIASAPAAGRTAVADPRPGTGAQPASPREATPVTREEPTGQRASAQAAPPAAAPAAAPAAPPPAPAAPPPAPAERAPAPASAAPADGRRGDVPAPDSAPSAIRRIVPSAPQPRDIPFAPSSGAKPHRSAARRLEATVIAYAVVIATAVAVSAYLAQR